MPAQTLRSFDPISGDLLWSGPFGSVDQAVEKARTGFECWSALRLEQRIEVANNFREIVLSNTDEFAKIIAKETGKPFWEAKTEVASTAGKIPISIAAQEERAGIRDGELAGAAQFVRHKPHGVLAVLGPYNFPAHLPNGHVVPALLAGNSVILKPSELTPLTALTMERYWAEAGLPDGVLQVLIGDGETGRDLSSHPQIDGLCFTGSSATGQKLHGQFATRPDKILALEMGGNNPLIAWDVKRTEIDAAAALIVQSAFQTAGQRCTCARRLIVEQGAGDQLVEAVLALSDRLIVGRQFDQPEPFMGSVISEEAAAYLEGGFERLVEQGAQVLRPLKRIQEQKPLLTPAILDATDIDTADEELFGPILKVIRVPSFEDAITAANDTHYGLAAGLVGSSSDRYQEFWRRSRAGIVNWNRPTTGAASNAPFGGVGASGNHRPSAYYAADYAAWPVASLEAESPSAKISTGVSGNENWNAS